MSAMRTMRMRVLMVVVGMCMPRANMRMGVSVAAVGVRVDAVGAHVLRSCVLRFPVASPGRVG